MNKMLRALSSLSAVVLWANFSIAEGIHGPVNSNQGAGTAISAPTQLTNDFAKEVMEFLQGKASQPPVGGGIVIKKKARVSCVAATIAAPGGPVSTNYSCTSELLPGAMAVANDNASHTFSGDKAKILMSFLSAPVRPSGGGGGIVVRKTGIIECVSSRTSTPNHSGGLGTPSSSSSSGAETYTCSNVEG